MDFPEIPGFEIIEKFPHGGMSHVYKARQISLDRVVVIKTLPPSLNAQYSDIKQFMFEARVAANLKHTNIVQVYDFGKQDTLYYFVMEYVDGYSVSDWIYRKGVISEQNSLILAEIVAKALDYAWNKARVIHCDIKPDNIMIDSDGTIKVADLGLAKGVRTMAEKASEDDSDIVMGTPNYISPEQARGDSDIDCRADMYSLGAMLYHMMTGVMPFSEFKPFDAMDEQVKGHIKDPCEINPEISMPAGFFIEKLMAKNKDNRYTGWPDVILDIKKIFEQKLPAVLPDNADSTVKRSEKRSLFLTQPKATPRIAKPQSKTTTVAGVKPVPRKENKRHLIMIAAGASLITAALIAAALLIPARLKTESTPQNKKEVTQPAQQEQVLVMPPVTRIEVEPDQERIAQIKKEEAEQKRKIQETEQKAEHAYQEALAWWENNPGQYDKAIRNFQRVAQQTKETQYSATALDQARKIEVARRNAADNVIARLKEQAEQLASENKFRQAADLYNNYNGTLAFETKDTRLFLAESLEKKHQAHVQKQRQQLKKARDYMERITSDIASACLQADLQSAKQIAQKGLNETRHPENNNVLKEMLAIISEAEKAEAGIMLSFQEQTGLEITVLLKSGERECLINEVSGTQVDAERIARTASGELRAKAPFTLNDLAIEEKMARLGSAQTPGLELARGVTILKDNDDLDAASKYFLKTGEHFEPLFEAQIRDLEKNRHNTEAETYLYKFCQRLGINADLKNPDAVFAALSAREYSRTETELCGKFVMIIRDKYSDTQFAARYKRVLEKIANIARQ